MKAARQRRSSAAARGTADAPLQDFGTADVARIVGLSATALRSLVRQGYVLPSRGTRGALRFAFQDLITLRAAHALAQAGLPTRRISRALRELRRHLPAQLPLSGLSIRAGGEHVVVREAGTEWEGGSGQYLLALEVSVGRGGLRLSETRAAADLTAVTRTHAASRRNPSKHAAAADTDRHAEGETEGETGGEAEDEADALFLEALAREDGDLSAAMLLYQRCLRADSEHLEARINLARLLQEAGDASAAERLYRHASCRDHAVAQFNLAVLLEDQGHLVDAIERYLSAVALDPSFADAHYNLARLYDQQGNAPHTIRHLRALQRLGRPEQE